MSKGRARRQRKKSTKPQPQVRRKGVIIASVALCLTIAFGVMAQWRALPNTSGSTVLTPPAPTGSFNANSPSKEYIYAGGRMIATEEPASSLTPDPSLSATCTAKAIRTLMTAGWTYRVTVTMKNTGTLAWTDATIKLGFKGDSNWNATSVAIPTSSLPINPGAEVTFDFEVTAPSTTGNYSFRWQMFKESATGPQFFGEQTQELQITVTTLHVDTAFDFDGDTRADIVVWRPTEGKWYILRSSGGTTEQVFGASGDTVMPGDYDGDHKTDLAVWRASDGNWYITNSTGGTITIQGWGQTGDIPVPGDYDSDGKTDLAVWRPSNGNWYITQSSTGAVVVGGFGQSGDKPAPGDYDGDGRTDYAVYRASEGKWYVSKSSGGIMEQAWGASGDAVAPADYDGDGKTDCAMWRPSDGTWYVLKSTGGVLQTQLGASSDKPVPADYDGDGKVDLAVWRPADGNWYILESSTNTVKIKGFGMDGDIPIATSYVAMP